MLQWLICSFVWKEISLQSCWQCITASSVWVNLEQWRFIEIYTSNLPWFMTDQFDGNHTHKSNSVDPTRNYVTIRVILSAMMNTTDSAHSSSIIMQRCSADPKGSHHIWNSRHNIIYSDSTLDVIRTTPTMVNTVCSFVYSLYVSIHLEVDRCQSVCLKVWEFNKLLVLNI